MKPEIPPDPKDVVAAASLGHRGDTAFSHFKSPCSLFPYPLRKFFFRWAQDKPMSPDQWKKLEHLLFCGRLHRRNEPAGFGRLASTPFLTAATMIGHAEKAALGANFVRGPRLIYPI